MPSDTTLEPIQVEDRPVFAVRRGAVTQEVLFDGVVDVADKISVTAPLDGVVIGPLPPPGTFVDVGDVLFEMTPTIEVRLAAAELEAALLAQDAGLGDPDAVAARVAVAMEVATSYGLPVGEEALQPLPDPIQVLSPISGTVVRSAPPQGEQIRGRRILEIGNTSLLVVRADLDEEVAGLIRIGQEVVLGGAGSPDPIPAVVNGVTVDASNRPVLSAVFGPGDVAPSDFVPGTTVVLAQTGRPDVAGTVVAVEVLASSLVVVEIRVDAESLSLDEAIQIAPRDGTTGMVGGDVTEIAVDDEGAPYLVVDVSGSDLEFGDRVVLSFAVSEKEDVLWIPPEAIRAYENESFVIALTSSGDLIRVVVRTGISNSERVEVVGDLAEGQQVIGQ